MYIETNREKIVELIIQNFPVMLASKKCATILINYTELVLHSDTFVTIIESEEAVNMRTLAMNLEAQSLLRRNPLSQQKNVVEKLCIKCTQTWFQSS